MRVDSPRWEEINPSAHAHEQDGLRELASYLPAASTARAADSGGQPLRPGQPQAKRLAGLIKHYARRRPGRGWVEPVLAPPSPRHIVAQQILALCLQQHQVGDQTWHQWWNDLAPFGPAAAPIVTYLVENKYLDRDNGMLFIGPAAELRFGYRNFMDMTAVFTGPPEFTVLTGRIELGRIDPGLLTEEVKGERLLLLGGRSCTLRLSTDAGVAASWNPVRAAAGPGG